MKTKTVPSKGTVAPRLPASAKPVTKPYAHHKTGQTVYYEAGGYAYTATGVPIAALPASAPATKK